DRAFHRREHEERQPLAIQVARQPTGGVGEALLNRFPPAGHILRNELSRLWMGVPDFERQVADRAAVLVFGLDQELAIARQDAKNPLDRVARPLEDGADD